MSFSHHWRLMIFCFQFSSIVVAQENLSPKIFQYPEYLFDRYHDTVYDIYLIGSSIENVKSMRQCEIKCNKELGCRSFFYNAYSAKCELMATDHALLRSNGQGLSHSVGWVYRYMKVGTTKGCDPTSGVFGSCIKLAADRISGTFTLDWTYPGDQPDILDDGSVLALTHQVLEVKNQMEELVYENNQISSDVRQFDFWPYYSTLTPGLKYTIYLRAAYKTDNVYLLNPLVFPFDKPPNPPTDFTYETQVGSTTIVVAWDASAFEDQEISQVEVIVNPNDGATCVGGCTQDFTPGVAGSITIDDLTVGTTYTVSMRLTGMNGMQSEIGQSSTSSSAAIVLNPTMASFAVTGSDQNNPAWMEITVMIENSNTVTAVKLTLTDTNNEMTFSDTCSLVSPSSEAKCQFSFDSLHPGSFYTATVETAGISGTFSPITDVQRVVGTFPNITEISLFAYSTKFAVISWKYTGMVGDDQNKLLLIRIVPDTVSCTDSSPCTFPNGPGSYNASELEAGMTYSIYARVKSTYNNPDGTTLTREGAESQITFFNEDIVTLETSGTGCRIDSVTATITGSYDSIKIYEKPTGSTMVVGAESADVAADVQNDGTILITNANLAVDESQFYWLRVIASSADYFGVYKLFELRTIDDGVYQITFCVDSGGYIADSVTKLHVYFVKDSVQCSSGNFQRLANSRTCNSMSCMAAVCPNPDNTERFKVVLEHINNGEGGRWDVRNDFEFYIREVQYLFPITTVTAQFNRDTSMDWTPLDTVNVGVTREPAANEK